MTAQIPHFIDGQRSLAAADSSPPAATHEIMRVHDWSGFNTFENPLGGDEMGGYGVLSMAECAELVGGRLNIPVPGAVTAAIPLCAATFRRPHQRLRFMREHPDIGEYLFVERYGGVFGRGAAEVGDLHQLRL